jgi:hypothetical protein
MRRGAARTQRAIFPPVREKTTPMIQCFDPGSFYLATIILPVRMPSAVTILAK